MCLGQRQHVASPALLLICSSQWMQDHEDVMQIGVISLMLWLSSMPAAKKHVGMHGRADMFLMSSSDAEKTWSKEQPQVCDEIRCTWMTTARPIGQWQELWLLLRRIEQVWVACGCHDRGLVANKGCVGRGPVGTLQDCCCVAGRLEAVDCDEILAIRGPAGAQ